MPGDKARSVLIYRHVMSILLFFLLTGCSLTVMHLVHQQEITQTYPYRGSVYVALFKDARPYYQRHPRSDTDYVFYKTPDTTYTHRTEPAVTVFLREVIKHEAWQTGLMKAKDKAQADYVLTGTLHSLVLKSTGSRQLLAYWGDYYANVVFDITLKRGDDVVLEKRIRVHRAEPIDWKVMLTPNLTAENKLLDKTITQAVKELLTAIYETTTEPSYVSNHHRAA